MNSQGTLKGGRVGNDCDKAHQSPYPARDHSNQAFNQAQAKRKNSRSKKVPVTIQEICSSMNYITDAFLQ